jgi:hypothetical protein
MDKIQFVRENFQKIFSIRLIWVFGLFAIANEIYPKSISQSEYISLRCVGSIVSIGVIALGTIGGVGLINIADSIDQVKKLSFKKVWKRSVRSFLKVFVVEILFGLSLLLPFSCVYFSVGSDFFNNTLYSCLVWFFSLIILIIHTLAACGIVINRLGITHSIVVGIRIFFKQPRALIILGITYYIFPMIIAYGCFFILAYLIDVSLLSKITLSITSYAIIAKEWIIAAILVVVHLLVIPFCTVLITQIYKAQISERDLKSGCIMAI